MSFEYQNQVVEQILAKHYRARTDDKSLILKVWEHYGLFLSPFQQQAFFSKKLPSTETIRRTRQKLQAEGKYKAPDDVLIARKERAEQTRQTIIGRQQTWFN